MPEGDLDQAHGGEPLCSIQYHSITALLRMKLHPQGSFTRKTGVSQVHALQEIPWTRFNTRLIRDHEIHGLQAKRAVPWIGRVPGTILERKRNRATEIERQRDTFPNGVSGYRQPFQEEKPSGDSCSSVKRMSAHEDGPHEDSLLCTRYPCE